MRTNDIFPLTGFTEDKRFSIYGDDFKFTFMENKTTGHDSKKAEIEDDLIRGYTHQGNQIAIACENEFEINGYRGLNTYCIFKSVDYQEEKTTEFNKITFTGGMLNTLFRRRSLDIDHGHKEFGVKIQNDAISYDFDCNGEHTTISLWSSVSLSNGWQEGTRIKNTDVNLSVQFAEKKSFSAAVKCYQNISDCIRFMMNRNNVGFDSISIMTAYGTEIVNDHNKFRVYFREEYVHTEKDGHRCITFEDLGESFVNLYLMFASSTNSDPKFSLGFFPKDDRDVYRITNNTIRSVCAALEFEASIEEEILPENNPALMELINSTKTYVKDYREIHDEISSSTYDRIFSSMDYWSFSAKDKIQKLWDIHKSAMNVLTRHIQQYYEIDIGKFISYRNKITHGAEIQATEEVAAITYSLRGLVYCCILKRIGINEEAIVELCQYQLNE